MDKCDSTCVKAETGMKAITENLIGHLLSFGDCSGLDLIVSFIKLSGYRMIEPMLFSAKKNHIPVRILTSTYMNITDISETSLTDGVEWNYEIDSREDPQGYGVFAETFEQLYANESFLLDHDTIVDYRRNHINRDQYFGSVNVNAHYMKYQNRSLVRKPKLRVADSVSPNEAQTEALIELRATKEAGNERAIVVAATGVGKTYLAALDSVSSDTVLFVAHREEILNQSYETFGRVRDKKDFGRLFAGYKETGKPVMFASVQSLSRKAYLHKYGKRFFRYIIIDEFHHACADGYKRILDHFEPEFLLGLTATPHRMDKKNIFQICDYNLVYEADLFSSINRGWLCPFKYLGIYDHTVDYDRVTFSGGKYVEKELEAALSVQERADLIYRNYLAHRRKRTLAFCSTIRHADNMAAYFREKGVSCVCVHSDSSSPLYCERDRAVKDLAEGNTDIIFSVDMLNEGVDIPAVDLLLFLRPTESATVFLQQLGRGLRKYSGKNDLKVLDFIGNYRKADLIPFLFGGHNGRVAGYTGSRVFVDESSLPFNCSVNFDLKVIDIFERLLRSKLRIRDHIRGLFDELAGACGGCRGWDGGFPSRNDFYNFLENDRYLEIKSNPKFNPFRDYNSFINSVDPDLLPHGYLDSKAHYLIRTIETTSMTALYKIPCLKAFIRAGGGAPGEAPTFRTSVSRADIARSFMEFYRNERNARDLTGKKVRKNYKFWSADDYFRLAVTNPIKYLCRTHGDIFGFDSDREVFFIRLDLGDFSNDPFFVRDLCDALDFRRNEFVDVRLGEE